MGRIKCLSCGKILESKYRHDLVGCGCPNDTFVDGGNDYSRMGGIDLELIEILIDAKKKPKKNKP